MNDEVNYATAKKKGFRDGFRACFYGAIAILLIAILLMWWLFATAMKPDTRNIPPSTLIEQFHELHGDIGRYIVKGSMTPELVDADINHIGNFMLRLDVLCSTAEAFPPENNGHYWRVKAYCRGVGDGK